MVSPLADQRIQNRKGGNAQQHSRKAEKSAAHHDGHQYPDCRQACTVSQYLGSEYIAVELLQCDDQDSKAQRAHGSTISRIITQGTAPMIGPKKGITLVTPMTTAMRMLYGICRIRLRTKQSTPMIALSMSLPLIKPTNTLFAWLHTLKNQLAFSVGKIAVNQLLQLRTSRSFPES